MANKNQSVGVERLVGNKSTNSTMIQHDSTYFDRFCTQTCNEKCEGFIKFPESMRSIDTPDRLGWTEGMVKDLQV